MNKKRPFISTGFFAVIGRAGGLILPFFIAIFYGANDQTDAFFFAYALIVALAAFFTPIFESILVPVFSKYKKSPDKISDLANGATWISLPAVLILSLLLWAALPWILMHWSGLNQASAKLVALLFLEMLPLLLFGIWIAGSGSIFYAHQIFWFPALSPILRFAWVLGLMILFHKGLGIHALTAGFSIGEILRWAAGLFLLGRLALWKFQTRWQDIQGELRNLFGQTFFQLLAFFAINMIPLTDQFFASYLGAGNVSLLNYANRLFQVPFQFCLVAMLQIFLSDWSEGFHQENRQALWVRVRKDIKNVLILGVILSVTAWFLRRWIVRLAFGFSHLSPEQLESIADVFGWLIIGFAPAVLHLMYVRILFVTHQSVIFCLQAWLKLLMNVVFNYLFMRLFGIRGIAMSTTLVFAVTAFWLYFYVERKVLTVEENSAG